MTPTGGVVTSVRYGTRSLFCNASNGGVVTPPVCESPDPCPWPGKCLSTGSSPASRRPRAYAPAYAVTVSGSLLNDRSPITVSSGWSLTSTTGAKSTVMPSFFMARPRCLASSYTASGAGGAPPPERGARRARPDQLAQPLDTATLFVHADRRRQRPGRNDRGE